jgi:hypothetical protein
MLKLKLKKDPQIYAFEFTNKQRELDLVKLWKENKQHEQSVIIRTKTLEEMKIQFNNIENLTFDNCKLLSFEELMSEL